MPSRINHVKIVCPNPHVVNAFLTQVCDIPEGWALGASPRTVAPDEPLGPGGEIPFETVVARRAAGGGGDGFISGDPSSRQFQIFSGEAPDVWAVCISTRYIEQVHERAVARGVPCTAISLVDWNERDDIRAFFCIVDDLMFEVIRVEPKASSAGA